MPNSARALPSPLRNSTPVGPPPQREDQHPARPQWGTRPFLRSSGPRPRPGGHTLGLPPMWSGHQSPGADHHPSDPLQPRQGQPNPYQQGPDPYQRGQQGQQTHGTPEQAPWATSAVPSGSPTQQPPPAPGGSGRSAVVAVIAATAVVIAAGVTGFLLLGKDGDDGKEASPGPAASTPASASPADGARGADGTDGPVPVVPGWKVVVNPRPKSKKTSTAARSTGTPGGPAPALPAARPARARPCPAGRTLGPWVAPLT